MNTSIPMPDRRLATPLWHQTEQAIRARITTGEWADGSQLPNEDRLCALLGVSRITLRHALRNVEAAGLIRREHGRGTFVRSGTMVAGARGLTSFTDEMNNMGMSVGTTLLDSHTAPADAEVADALDIEPGSTVVVLRRLRLGNGEPMGIQTAHLPLARVPGFLDEPMLDGSLYRTLADRYGIKPVEAREVYRLGRVAAGDAQLLGLAADSPAFVVERTTVDAGGPFEFTISTMRGDRYEIRSTLRL